MRRVQSEGARFLSAASAGSGERYFLNCWLTTKSTDWLTDWLHLWRVVSLQLVWSIDWSIVLRQGDILFCLMSPRHPPTSGHLFFPIQAREGKKYKALPNLLVLFFIVKELHLWWGRRMSSIGPARTSQHSFTWLPISSMTVFCLYFVIFPQISVYNSNRSFFTACRWIAFDYPAQSSDGTVTNDDDHALLDAIEITQITGINLVSHTLEARKSCEKIRADLYECFSRNLFMSIYL